MGDSGAGGNARAGARRPVIARRKNANAATPHAMIARTDARRDGFADRVAPRAKAACGCGQGGAEGRDCILYTVYCIQSGGGRSYSCSRTLASLSFCETKGDEVKTNGVGPVRDGVTVRIAFLSSGE